MFAPLAEAIDTLEVPVDERSLRTLAALHDRLTAKFVAAVADFDDAGLWAMTGATSMRAWLRDEGIAGPDATRTDRTARRLRQLPGLRAAWVNAELSVGQVRVVVEHLTDRTVGLFREHEHDLVPTLVGLGVNDTAQVMNKWRAHADAIVEPQVKPEPERSLAHSETLGGRWVTSGGFDPEGGAVIATALGVADCGDLGIAPPQRRADALIEVCRFFLDHHHENVTARQRPHIALIVDADDLARYGDDTRSQVADHRSWLDAATTSTYLCDCSISRVVAEKVAGSVSRVLDLGRSTESVSAAQRAALAVRDRHCRYPGCDRPASWTDAHHVRWWTRGGPTDLDNLVLLCRRHHRLLHTKRGYEAKLLPDATLVITLPNGTTRTSRPPGRLQLT